MATLHDSFKNQFRTYIDKYVDITVKNHEDGLSYNKVYKVIKPPAIIDSVIHVHNYIDNHDEIIKLEDIECIEYVCMGETEQFHKDRISKLCDRAGWNRDNWGIVDVDDEVKNRFEELYFQSYCGARITPEEAYLLAKLDIPSMFQFDLMSVEDLKHKWNLLILDHKNHACNMLEQERRECYAKNETDDVQEIDVILSLLGGIDKEVESELISLNTKNEILNYWPPLLLPAPAYVQLKYE